jgi:citrate synthase
MTDPLTAAEAARRLGVKPATLYAYVSRGILLRTRDAAGRASLFDADEVERLARRGRPRRPAGSLDITVESQITEIAGDRLRYRGLDVLPMARSRTFEEVAALLWTGAFPSHVAGLPGTVPPGTLPPGTTDPGTLPPGTADPVADPAGAAGSAAWQAPALAIAVGAAAQAALPPGTFPLERLQVIVPAMAATDPLRLELDPAAVIAAGRSIIAGMVECLPAPADAPVTPPYGGTGERRAPGGDASTGPGTGSRHGIAERLWARLTRRRPSAALLRALSAALVLLADHELAASTLAARAAASVRADPYAVVATGLGAVGGALHGGASLGAETMLAAANGPGDVPRVVGDLLRRGEKVPGFGHFVYRAGDPRALLLLGLVREATPRSRQLAVAEAVLAEVRQRSLPEPNIDFALAALSQAAGLPRGSSEAIFAVARTAGWIAHALEAYASGTPIRPRASYVGPGSNT